MKRMLALALVGLTATAVAQAPNTLVPGKKAGVEVQFGTNTAISKTLPDLTPITKPVYLRVYDKPANTRYYNAYASFSANTFGGGHHYYGGMYYGAQLCNHGKVYGNKTAGGYAKGFDQEFTWKYGDTKTKLNGTLKVYFSGYAYGGATVSAVFDTDTFKSDPQKPGNFSFKKEYPVKDALGLAKAIKLAADTGAIAKEKRGSYNACLRIYFYPTVATKTLVWSVPTQTANCAKGAIGTKGTVALGQKFDITLTGATDVGQVKEPMAMLFYGMDIQNWWFLPLPMDLAGFGAKGCELRLAIMGSMSAKIDQGAAAFPKYLSTYYRYRGMKPIYFQIAYMTDTNKLGLVFTDYGMLEIK